MAWLSWAARLLRWPDRIFPGEATTKSESIFAVAYLACAVIALIASRMRSNPVTAATAPFWLRIAVVCGLFALLRYFDAHMAVSATFRDLTQSYGLPFWERPGSYVMLAAITALGLALVGLLVFRPRSLHRSVQLAAMSIVLLLLLAVAHSVSLYWTGVYLESTIGAITISRIIEVALLALIALAGLWFINDAKGRPNARVPTDGTIPGTQ